MIYAIITLIIIGIFISIQLIFKPFTRKEKPCTHIWSEVKDGWQYCSICGLARVAGCVHHWEIETHQKITRKIGDTDSHVGDETHYICKKCTQRKYVRTSLNEEPIVKLL